MSSAFKVLQETLRETRSYFIITKQSWYTIIFLGDQTKHMHIQDAFHQDGISYGSGDEFSDTDSDPRSSQENFDKDNSPNKEKSSGNYS